MHVFLQGPRNIGKSTVLCKTLNILSAGEKLVLGGFLTWKDGRKDPHVYMKPVLSGYEGEIYKIASYDTKIGAMTCDVQVFEQEGVHLLEQSKHADLIIMDELGFLEGKAPGFRNAVLRILAGDVPVFGVLRLGDIPWFEEIKRNPLVRIYDVNKKNRDELPRQLAKEIDGFLANGY